MVDSTAWRTRPDVLREHFRRDGYLLLRGVLDRQSVVDLREHYLARLTQARDQAAATEPSRVDAPMDGELPAYGTCGHPAYDLVRSSRFDAFTRDERLAGISETLLDGPSVLLPRRIVRQFDPLSGNASRAHVDFDYLDRGGDDLVTAWIPIGDCTVECGGLVYLEGSHLVEHDALDQLRAFTDRPEDLRPVSNDLGLTARTLGGRWLWTDFGAGDVVWHSPHMVHASLDNISDATRLSVDIRFRRHDTTADDRWNGDWSADDGF
jgi:ectoine hydroxylase-related dioxygenase (phytanoyl-CoA dioxygenase family)